jgi:hypothetical protein
LIQHHVTKRWIKTGKIIKASKNRDYHVMLPSGRVYWRNRRFLRPLVKKMSSDESEEPKTTRGRPC